MQGESDVPCVSTTKSVLYGILAPGCSPYPCQMNYCPQCFSFRCTVIQLPFHATAIVRMQLWSVTEREREREGGGGREGETERQREELDTCVRHVIPHCAITDMYTCSWFCDMLRICVFQLHTADAGVSPNRYSANIASTSPISPVSPMSSSAPASALSFTSGQTSTPPQRSMSPLSESAQAVSQLSQVGFLLLMKYYCLGNSSSILLGLQWCKSLTGARRRMLRETVIFTISAPQD